MALPRKLKNMNIFNEGASYLGEAASCTLPKLTRKFEGWRGAGMDAEVKIDMGGEPLEMEWSTGGPMRDAIRQFGAGRASAHFLRFAGVYQNDGTGEVDTVEVTVRGRHEEIDMGEAKPGEGGEFKVKTALTYYRLEWNGVVEVEIDLLNLIFTVGGVDRLAEQRAAIL
jgi:hypothetical protein